MSSSDLEELKITYINNKNKVVIGTERTIKYIKRNMIDKVYIVKNIPENIKEDLKYYSKIGNFKLIELDISNEELGALIKKPFKISVISILK